MSFKVFSIPFSFTELNDCLDSCKIPEELRHKIPLETLQGKPITQENFIKAIRYPFESYTDLTFQCWAHFLTKVKRLFPKTTPNDNEALNKLQELFKKRIILLNPSLSSAPPKEEGKLSFAQVTSADKKSTKNLSTDEMLAIYSTQFTIPPEVRIKKMLNVDPPSTPEEQANQFHLILNMLMMETDLMRLCLDFVEPALVAHQLTTKLRAGNVSVMRLSGYTEATLFAIPSTIEDSEEFALWINLSDSFSLRKKEDKLYACFVPLSDEELRIKEWIPKLHSLKAGSSNSALNSIIEKLLLWREVSVSHYEHWEKMIALMSFVKRISSSLLAQQGYPDKLEKTVVPAAYFLFALLRNHINSWFKDEIQDIPFEHVQDFKKTITFWQTHREKQRSLFEQIKTRRDALIQQQTGKTKIRFLSLYTKDITHETIAGLLPDYPSDGSSQETKELPEPAKTAKPKVVKTKKNSSPSKSPKTKSPVEEKLQIEAEAPVSEPIEIGEPFPYFFDERVERWHQHLFGEPLSPEIFPEYQNQSLEYQRRMHVFHQLNHMVDRFLSLAIKASWQNSRGEESLRFIIPAEVTFQGKRHRGFLSYAVDKKTDICYHKFFTEKVDQDILSTIIHKTFNENDFPDLQQAHLSTQAAKPIPIELSQTQVTIDPIFGNVLITDNEKDITIKLFKTR